MRAGDAGDLLKAGDPIEYLKRVIRVAFDLLPLLICKLVGLIQNRVRQTQLADVVQQCGVAKGRQIFSRHLEARADECRNFGDARRVG